MPVAPSGNLTVKLIRLSRFGFAGCNSLHPQIPTAAHDCLKKPAKPSQSQQIDKVCLSPEALRSCAKSGTIVHADSHSEMTATSVTKPVFHERLHKPREITPVLGSPALAGLGVALVVPGTLLDVVA